MGDVMLRVLVQYALLLFIAAGLLASQLLLKQGVSREGMLSLTSLAEFSHLIRHLLTTPSLLLGYGISGVTALLWLVILSRMELSYAAPMLTAIYSVLLLATSALVLHEAVTPLRWIGVLLVIVGIICLSKHS